MVAPYGKNGPNLGYLLVTESGQDALIVTISDVKKFRIFSIMKTDEESFTVFWMD